MFVLYKTIIKLSLGKYRKTSYWLLSSSVFDFLTKCPPPLKKNKNKVLLLYKSLSGLTAPNLSESSLNQRVDNAFAVAVPKLFNSFPNYITETTTVYKCKS